MDEWLESAKALSDQNRVRVLLLLQEGELCACHLIRFLGLAPSTVSAHMAILRRAGLVEVRKDGRWRHYRLADMVPGSAQAALFEALVASLAHDPVVKHDASGREHLLCPSGSNDSCIPA